MLGAFKATPIRQLETESYVRPLDLWLNGRIARFQARMEHSEIVQKVRMLAALYGLGFTPYKSPETCCRTASYHTRGRTEAMGRRMDRTATGSVGLAGEET